jgi:hypothetical protein
VARDGDGDGNGDVVAGAEGDWDACSIGGVGRCCRRGRSRCTFFFWREGGFEGNLIDLWKWGIGLMG